MAQIYPRIPTGIVGCGEIVSGRHLPALQHVPGIRISALADPHKERLESLADRYQIEARFPDHQALVDSPQVDLIAVCTPPALHTEIALAALAAGKHVFIEKPLLLSLDEYDELRKASQEAKAKILVGYNMRWHRLVQATRAFLFSGGLGEVTAAYSTFGVLQKRAFLGGWRTMPDQGGDLLNDLAAHHFDLLRHLLGSDFHRVSATYALTSGHIETASITAELANGIPITTLVSFGIEDRNTLELLGTRGRLVLDYYRYDGFMFYPAGPYGVRSGFRLQGALRSLLSLPRGFIRARQGGDYALSYQAMWQHFAECILHGEPVACTLEDGYQASLAALAALQSVSASQPLLVESAPRTPPLLPILEEHVPARPSKAPALSAIVVIPDTYDTVRHTMGHLQTQSAAGQMEIVLVVPECGAAAIDENSLAGFHSWQVVELGNISSIARAYAAGVRRAGAPLVTLTEDHSFPQPGWAEALIAAHQLPWAAVGPAMLNGNPDTQVSWADFFIAYGEWSGHKARHSVQHLPGHNSCYKRDLLLALDDRLDDLLEAETVLHWTLRTQGHQLLLEPAAKTRHLNFAFWSSWVPIQYYSGRMFASTRAHDWPLWRCLLFAIAAPLIPLVRLMRIRKHIYRCHSRGFMVRLLPTLLAGLALDGLGQMVGYAFGPGNSIAKAASYEFHRVRHIRQPEEVV